MTLDNKNNERFTQRAFIHTEDMVTLAKLPMALKTYYPGFGLVIGPCCWSLARDSNILL